MNITEEDIIEAKMMCIGDLYKIQQVINNGGEEDEALAGFMTGFLSQANMFGKNINNPCDIAGELDELIDLVICNKPEKMVGTYKWLLTMSTLFKWTLFMAGVSDIEEFWSDILK